jgi:mRNA-degrading endonuclease RelE of RelBE toxin-antitoxin system
MTQRTVFFTDEFQANVLKLAKRYRHIRADLEPIIEQLSRGETLDDQLSGVGWPVFKVRVRNQDARRGKSGGYRLIYYLQTKQQVVLLTLYSKTDQSDIEVRAIGRYLQAWEDEHSE